MPMPKPTKGEEKKVYLQRFMENEDMIREYPDEKQRYAVAMNMWTKHKIRKIRNQIAIVQLRKTIRTLLEKVGLTMTQEEQLIRKLQNYLLNTYEISVREEVSNAIRMLARFGEEVTSPEMQIVLSDLETKLGADFAAKVDQRSFTTIEKVYLGAQAEILALKPSFNVTDLDALKWMRSNQKYWIGNYYSTDLQDEVAKIGEAVVKGQMTGDMAAKFFKEAFADLDPVSRAKGYWEGFANHVITRAREFGHIEAYSKAKVQYIEFMAVIDHRTSPVCREMNGRIMPLSWMIETRDKLIAAGDPEKTKDIAPWLTPKQVIEQVTGKDVKELPHHLSVPPLHFRCRSRTVVSTAEAFKEQNKEHKKEIKQEKKAKRAKAPAGKKDPFKRLNRLFADVQTNIKNKEMLSRVADQLENLQSKYIYNYEMLGTESRRNTWASSSHNKLNLARSRFNDPVRFQKELDQSLKTGWHPFDCNTLESVITHEFAHHLTITSTSGRFQYKALINGKLYKNNFATDIYQIRKRYVDELSPIVREESRLKYFMEQAPQRLVRNGLSGTYWLSADIAKELNRATGFISKEEYFKIREQFLPEWERIKKAKNKIFISEYANSSLQEFIAESFAMYTHSSKVSPYAKEAGELIDKYFSKATWKQYNQGDE